MSEPSVNWWRTRAAFLGVITALVVASVVVFLGRDSGGASGGSPPTPAASSGIATPSASKSPKPTASTTPASTPTNIYSGIEGPGLSSKVADDPAYVYVPNGTPGTLEVIDPNTFKIVRTYHFGSNSLPEHVTPSWDLRWLYVDVNNANELGVIDPRTGRLVRTIHDIEDPYNLYFTPDGSAAIDVAEYYRQLRFYNPHTWKLVKAVDLPCNGPDHLDYSPPGSTYLMISCEYDGTVVKVDWKKLKVLGSMKVEGLPVDVKLSPDGKYFFVANQGLGGVSVVNPRTMHVVKFIRTGHGAHGMAISRDTKDVYVSNRLAGTISVISFAAQKVVATWNVGGSPDMIQVTPDGKEIWVSNRYDATVSVISTRTGHVVHQIQVGPDPHGLSYFPQPGNYSLGHNGVYR